MDFGISSSAGRFIAERRGDRQAIASYVADALRLKVAISGVLALVLFVGAAEIADLYGNPTSRGRSVGSRWPWSGAA